MNILNIDSSDLARRMRVQALQMVHRAKASHIGSALSICDIVAVLYAQTLKLAPREPTAPWRDRFILSKGHACVAVYAALAETGFFPIKDLLTYGQDHSALMNHISHKVLGVEFSTGSLGHGLPFGAGKALAAKRLKQDWRTFVLLSDGELGEGSNWEAMMFAAHHHLNNLVAIVDYNKLQSLTTVDKTLRIEPLADKARAFGWAVHEVDGHDHRALRKLFSQLNLKAGKPSFLIAHTIKGKGVSFMENSVEWHYKSPSTDQLALALGELNHA
ncbi:transketolase [Zwartia panacis]|uniref:transketolase n=1 Tax=Zwartia panacis TaxID=2683345 RepID=UPI0025B5D595|nr:transketolase [Zwartia panacis]MDN4018018.1 transketolase [Zwartia panacis]